MNAHPTSPLRPAVLAPRLAANLPLRAVLALTATLLIAAAAHVTVPLPFTPVPLTMQPLAVLCVGLLLGPVDGALALAAYLLEGSLGAPVFAPTGPGGLLQLMGPTGGFLMSYPAVAFAAGYIASVAPIRSRFAAGVISTGAASIVLFASGSLWLMHFAHLSPAAVLTAAVLPFVPGGIVHVLVAAGIYSAVSHSHRIP